MMLDWKEYQKQIAAKNAQIGKANHEILKGVRGLSLSRAGKATNLHGPKAGELVALTVGVITRYKGLSCHTYGCCSCNPEEIVEALGVTASVNAGAPLIFASGVMDAFNANT